MVSEPTEGGETGETGETVFCRGAFGREKAEGVVAAATGGPPVRQPFERGELGIGTAFARRHDDLYDREGTGR